MLFAVLLPSSITINHHITAYLELFLFSLGHEAIRCTWYLGQHQIELIGKGVGPAALVIGHQPHLCISGELLAIEIREEELYSVYVPIIFPLSRYFALISLIIGWIKLTCVGNWQILIVLSGKAVHKIAASGATQPDAQQAQRHELRSYLEPLPEQERFEPLMDNLEAQTYETFEKDSVKYIQVSQICFQDSYFHHL
ncbi:hypothetical protein LXL04_022680 [Taraxacum kok-saghyz]